MNWKKYGILFRHEIISNWSFSHVTCPTPIYINNKIRVFYATRDIFNIGRIGFFDISIDGKFSIINRSTVPVLDIGEAGCFDDNGVMPTSVVRNSDGSLFLYYAGFELCKNIRYRMFTGLAISYNDGLSFERVSSTPILDRSNNELFIRGGFMCFIENNLYRAWYVSGSHWINIGNKQMPVYNIRYLESSDGITWDDKGKIHLDVSLPDEHAFGRPYVYKKLDGSYSMFYSIRRISFLNYRMGYAESNNSYDWIRKDNEINFDVTVNNFDSEAVMYAAPINVNNKIYVLYNGNDFGSEGVGLALMGGV